MRELPTGTVTFLFSDIEGSTRMLRALGREAYLPLQDRHAEVLRSAIETGGGVEIRTEGDAFFAVFATAPGAVGAAVEAQRGLAATPWPEGGRIRVRIGMHTGDGTLGGDDYLGLDVHEAARIAATGHGGQVVLSAATAALVERSLPDGVVLRNLGAHAMKDFEEPAPLFDLAIDGLDDRFPPLRTVDARQDVLPRPRTSFVGRAQAIAEIAGTVTATRLTTLTGPGGTGKTRLAIQTAASVAHRFPDGVVFVDLSAISQRDLVVPEIARVLRVRPRPDGDEMAAVLDHLQDRRLLLVLDNVEQLTAHADLVAALLDGAPELAVLATSRIPLRIGGEVECPVPPLALPEPGAAPASLAAADAVRLFLDRAGDARPGFAIDDANAATIVEIVTKLDALPLAIELAAARLRVLDVDSLAARLDHRLALLTTGAVDAPARHRTLEASIRWSEESLDPAHRRLFARLAVFAGGWSFEAAEAVCPDVDVLDGLTALVESSLVRRSGDDEAVLRFRMLETIREYALERFRELPADEQGDAERRHRDVVRALAAEAEPWLTSEEQLVWLDRLERDHDNIRAVLDRAASSGARDDVAAALEIGAGIWRFWQQRGHLEEGRTHLDRLLALPAARAADATRVRALGALGSLEYWLGRGDTFPGRYEEAATIARDLDDPRLLARSLFDLAFASLPEEQQVHAERAAGYLREGLAVAPEDDVVLRGRIQMAIGYTHLMQGDGETALALLDAAIACFREAQERVTLSESIVSLAAVRFMLGDMEGASATLREAIALVAESPGPMLLADVIVPCAVEANALGRHRRAAVLAGAWDGFLRRIDARFPDVATNQFGDPADVARAALGDEAFDEAAAIGRAMDDDAILAFILTPSED